MRVFGSASLVATGELRELLDKACFRCVREMIEHETAGDILNIQPGITAEAADVAMPLRVNWAGSWTDTPPYCLENGGAVINAAVCVNTVLPVNVHVKRIPALKVILEYFDSELRCEYLSPEELSDFTNPGDPFSLLKAALTVCGLAPSPYRNDDLSVFEKLSGGLHLSAGVIGIPKGSGLGTSSILLAACIKALLTFLGVGVEDADLCRRVLLAEQIMGTGGGWQDQAGGLVGGIKLVASAAGNRQTVCMAPLSVPGGFLDELNRRFCLVYSGQRRLGRTVLREMMGGYIRRDPVFLKALDDIHSLAFDMKANIETGRMTGFIDNINRQTQLTKSMDTGYINPRVGRILDACKDLTAGAMICGAGGGGFLQIFLSPEYTKQDLNNRLEESFPQQGIEVWRCDFCAAVPHEYPLP